MWVAGLVSVALIVVSGLVWAPAAARRAYEALAGWAPGRSTCPVARTRRSAASMGP